MPLLFCCRYLASQREYQSGCTISLKHCLLRTCCVICGRRFGNYLVVLYIFTKIIFIINVIGQLFLLNAFLGPNFHFYGIEVITSLTQGIDWTESDRFPCVTMCDFKVRHLGNIQRYTVQCVLPINLFNEKIYLFIWFWMVFVAALTCFSLLSWIMRVSFRSDCHHYIRKHLRLMDKIERESDKKMATGFVDKYLRQDGVFVMRLVGHNTNAITVTEFLCSLWDNYRAEPLLEMADQTSNTDV